MPELPEVLLKNLSEGELQSDTEELSPENQAQAVADILIGKMVSPVVGLEPKERIQILGWFDQKYPLGIDEFKKRMSTFRTNAQKSILNRLKDYPELLERLK